MADQVNIPWDRGAPTPTSPVDAMQKGLAFGLDYGQKKATISALQGIDINNPDSVNSGITALVRAGATDQANALTGLSINRDLARALPQFMSGLTKLGGKDATSFEPTTVTAPEPAADGQTAITPDHVSHMADTMTQAGAAVDKLLNTPEAGRQAAFADIKKDMLARGVPEAAIDAAGHDLSTPALTQLKEYYASHASGMSGATMDAPHAVQPPPTGYEWSKTMLQDPNLLASLGLFKSKFGIDFGPLLDTAKSLAMPGVEAQAKLQYAGPTTFATKQAENMAGAPPVAGMVQTGVDAQGAPVWSTPQGMTAGITQATNAKGIGETAATSGGRTVFDANGNPIVEPVPGLASTAAGFKGAEAGAMAGATAAATAPYELVPGITDPNTGAPLYRTKTDLAQGNVPSAGASPGQGNLNIASANQLAADRTASGQLQAALVPLRTAYDLVNKGGVQLGPGSETFNRMKSFVLSTLGPNVVNADQVANYDQVHKYLVQIANQRATQFGAGTNEKLAVAASGSPNVDMSNLGAAEVLRMNIALARADAAKSAAYGNGAPEGYGRFAADYGRSTDPRAFMLDLLSPAQRSTLYASVRKETPSAQSAFARGVLAAEAAGYFHRGDLKR